MDDIRAVMDGAGSERALVCGVSEGGPMALMFAATYPERTRGLIIYGSLPRFVRGPGFPWREPRHEFLAEWEADAQSWGSEESAREELAQSGMEVSDEAVRLAAQRQRLSASPGAVMQLARMNAEIDVRPILGTVRVPTLVLHREEDHIPIEGARWMADQIPGARFTALPGGPHFPFVGDWESVVAAIRDFALSLTGAGARGRPRHRALHRPGRLDGDGGRARRPALARAARAASRAHPRRARPLSWGSSSTPPETGSSRGSTARRVRSAARAPSGSRSPRSTSTCAQAYTLASARCSTARSPALRSRSAPAWRRGRRRARCSSRRPCGPGRGLGHRVRGPRRRRAQGRARWVALYAVEGVGG